VGWQKITQSLISVMTRGTPLALSSIAACLIQRSGKNGGASLHFSLYASS